MMNINLNFKPRFAMDVAQGYKRQSIRRRGKRLAEVGDTLHLFTGMRTKTCRRLGQAVCKYVLDIDLDAAGQRTYLAGSDRLVSDDAMRAYAELDGFDGESLAGFYAFFLEAYGPGRLEMRLYQW